MLVQVDFFSLSKCVASHVISVLVLFCSRYCLDPTITSVSGKDEGERERVFILYGITGV